MDSNSGPLVLEATTLPTKPQPMPLIFMSIFNLVSYSLTLRTLPIRHRSGLNA